MNNTTTISTEVSFKDFLFKDKRNRTILILAGVAIVLQFAFFKYLYPFASFIHGDSFSYITAAYENKSINTYMVGYSNFIRFISIFTKSDTILVAIQYLLIQASSLFLLFTLFYFYKLGKVVQVILLIFFVFNPLLLHLSNLVSSDCYFVALSLIWFTLLLWLLHQPSNLILFSHILVLFISFTVRYNALLYPFISLGVLFIIKLRWKIRLIGIGLMVLLCGYFVGFTSYKYKQLTGYWQYSPFSGWQWANNAMYAYRHVPKEQRKPVPKEFQQLDNMIREFYDSTRDTKKFPTEALMASTFYMWSPTMPLMKYRNNIFKKDTLANELKKWAYMSPLYKRYGIYIAKKYPLYFIRYFILPNAVKYYAPPVEFLEDYNSGKNYTSLSTIKWFDYKSSTVKVRMGNKKVWVLNFYPILSGVINVVMFLSILSFAILNGFKENSQFKKTILLNGIIWLLNAGFTISASPAALRFQSFPILITTTISILLINWMVQILYSHSSQGKRSETKSINKEYLNEIIA